MATFNLFPIKDEDDRLYTPAPLTTEDYQSTDPIVIKGEDSDQDMPHSLSVSTSSRRSGYYRPIKRSSAAIALDDIPEYIEAPSSTSRLTTTPQPPKKKAKSQPDNSEVVELKAKLRKVSTERNKEKQNRIANDKALKTLRKDLEKKDQALVRMAVDHNQVLEKVKGLETGGLHLRKKNDELTKENDRLKEICNEVTTVSRERDQLSKEVDERRLANEKLQASAKKMESELLALREYKAKILAASAL